jgi:hypothetical protein
MGLGQRIQRVLMTFFGPAQLSRRPSSDSRLPEGAGPDAVPRDAPPPAGYRVHVYTDASGVTHTSIVRDERPADPRP